MSSQAAIERQRERCRKNRQKNGNYNAYKKKHRAALRAFIDSLKSAPCMDCAQHFPPCAMQFDHRPGEKKVACISHMVQRQFGRDTILEEIAKCDLVCSNCHLIRTHILRRCVTIEWVVLLQGSHKITATQPP